MLKPHHIAALKHIALLGGLHESVILTSKQLGIALGVSQQTASQRLLDLINDGLISRDIISRREYVKLTPKGMEVLRREHADYKRLFEVGKKLLLKGTIVSGLGEGAFYMRQKGYKEQFKKKLLYDPYEGTLNLRLSSSDISKLDIMRQSDGIDIDPFESDGRTYGGAKCLPAKIANIDCTIIMPKRSHHSDIVEVISKQNLRGKLGLKDRDIVELSVFL